MKCPVCALTNNPMPSFCPRCAWDLKNDLTLNTFLSAPPEKDLTAYKQRLEIARRNWVYIQDMKKKQNARDSNPEPPQKILPAKDEDHEERAQRVRDDQNISTPLIQEKDHINKYNQVSSEEKSSNDKDFGHVSIRKKCPLCGMRNDPDMTFECRICGKDYLCPNHFVKEQRCCEDCSTITARDERYIAHKEGIVEDTLTGLEWIVGQSAYNDRIKVNYWVNSLLIGGGDWRLPTCDELLGLYQIEAGHRSLTPLLQISTNSVWTKNGGFSVDKQTSLDLEGGRKLSRVFSKVLAVRTRTSQHIGKAIQQKKLEKIQLQWEQPLSKYVKLGLNGIELSYMAESWIMVRDSERGLVWETKMDISSVKNNRQHVKGYINNSYVDDKYYSADEILHIISEQIRTLNRDQYGGYSDWGIPTIEELKTIVDYSENPTIDQRFFPDALPQIYWSCTREGHNLWGLDFNSGKTIDNYFSLPYNYRITSRAVRGGLIPAQRFIKLGLDGNKLPQESSTWVMVRDNKTNLIWDTSNDSAKETYNWNNLYKFLNKLNKNCLGGYSDWRIPTTKEFREIGEPRNIYKNFFSFKQSPSEHYWSCEGSDTDRTDAWAVNPFHSFNPHTNRKWMEYYVIAVRG